MKRNKEKEPLDLFNYHTFPSLMLALKKEYTQRELARKLLLSAQKVNLAFNDRPHLVYPEIGKWRRGFKFKRAHGDYFELLAAIHAYPHSARPKRPPILTRIFHLTGRLEQQLNPSGRPMDSLIYWLDPLFSVLRNMVEMNDFPVDEEEVPVWVIERLSNSGVLNDPQLDVPFRIESAWKWMRDLKAVVYSKSRKRWVKAEPNIMTAEQIGPEVKTLTQAIYTFRQCNIFQVFEEDAGTPDTLGLLLATFPVPCQTYDLLDHIFRNFLFENILKKFNYMVNLDDLKRLKTEDPDYYRRVMDFKAELEEKGFEIPQLRDKDVDSVIQVLLAHRRAARQLV